MGAYSKILLQYTKEGEGILVFTPAYHGFFNDCRFYNRIAFMSQLIFENNRYMIDYKDLEK